MIQIKMRVMLNPVVQRIRDHVGVLAVWGLLSAAIFPAAVLAGERTVIDDLGFKVAVKGDVRRVVSLVPTNSEMVCLLDCERLKGGTRYDQFPEELRKRLQRKQIETIGGGFDANLERIVQLQPDLILTNGPSQQRFAVPLRNLGYKVVSLWPRDLDGLKRDFLLLGELLGQADKAQRLIAEVQRQFTALVASARHQRKKRVYLQMWTEPLITVGKASFPDWMVDAAGGVNVFGDMPFDSGQISLESLIQRNPEVLIFLADQESFAKTLEVRRGWSAIAGVRDAHFCFIEEPDIRRSVMFSEGLIKIHGCRFRETLRSRRPESQ
ncbi:MAG: ABC transporter substrate-binding protein [Candidatus Binatia bacterium]